MTHRRKPESLKRRQILYDQKASARRFVDDQSFNDFWIKEKISRSTKAEVDDHLSACFEGVVIQAAIPDIEPGSVLSDSLGRGVFQTEQ